MLQKLKVKGNKRYSNLKIFIKNCYCNFHNGQVQYSGEVNLPEFTVMNVEALIPNATNRYVNQMKEHGMR